MLGNRILIHIRDILKMSIAISMLPFYKLFTKEKIYLIGERKDQCQDNGYHLFKYIRENHPEDRVYYCITKDSKQLKKISGLGNIIYHGTVKHYIYYILAEKIVAAHLGSCDPESPIIWKLEGKGKIEKYKIFIQHGITKELIPSLMKENTGIKSFICGAKPEYEYIKENFGYKENEVKYLGFCRFDNLHDFKEKNQILLMPTWRAWFGGSTWGGNNDDEFLQSKYYKRYESLINNNELIKYLGETDMYLVFYPHHEMQRYLKYFNTNNKRVKIADADNYDVQKLLKESKILITDYSSIAFDFAYMRKPIIYYQFDQEEYFSKHYKKGYFDYDRDGFGIVVRKEEEVIRQLFSINNKATDNKYLERINKFFYISNKDNCKRHYEVLKSLQR